MSLPVLPYQAYKGQFQEVLGCYLGTVDNGPDRIICRGYSVADVKRTFGLAIGVYLALCQRNGLSPKVALHG